MIKHTTEFVHGVYILKLSVFIALCYSRNTFAGNCNKTYIILNKCTFCSYNTLNKCNNESITHMFNLSNILNQYVRMYKIYTYY